MAPLLARILVAFGMGVFASSQACNCDPEEIPQGRDAGTVDAQINTVYADMDGAQHLVSLGDSVASGFGVPQANSFSSLVLNNSEMYAEFNGRDLATLRPGSDRFGLAVMDAHIDEVERNQVVNVPRSTTLAVIAIGINDLFACAGDDAATGAQSAAQFGAKLDAVFIALKDISRFTALPHLYIVNLIDATDGQGDTRATFGFDWPDYIDVLAAFNAEIARSAQAYGATVVDIHNAFLGHGVHYSELDNPYYEGNDPTLWLQRDSMNPNPRGHSEIRRMLMPRLLGE